jgi:iron-sulfur cluster repair protein YtfE (RIC family)
VFRFTDLVRASEVVRDVKQKYPETGAVFERFGLRPSCYDCSIHQAARKVGAVVDDLLAELNEAIQHARSVTV